MPTKEQSVEAILRGLVNEEGITKVARDLGIDHASLYRSLKDNSNLKWGRIKKLLDYFGYEFRIVKKRVNRNPTLRS
jgi:DNA-binding phage protein